MLVKHRINGAIFPYSELLMSTGKFIIYDPLAPIVEDLEIDVKNLLKFYTKSTITKRICETELEVLLSDKEYRDLLKRLYG